MIKTFPETIVRKILDNDDFSSLLNSPRLGYNGIGSFFHEDILAALEKIRNSEGQVPLDTRNGKHFLLGCSSDGIRIAPAENPRDARLVPELSFLDPERDARLAALDGAMKQCWPLLPNADEWQSVLSIKPLTERELVSLVADIQTAPSQWLGAMERKWCSGDELDADSFFPTSLGYYETLVAPPFSGMTSGVWIDSVLIPHLKQRLSKSLVEGLRWALALNIDVRLFPASLVSDVPLGEVISALRRLMDTRSHLVLLGIVEIAVSRTDGSDVLPSIASDALDRLIGKKSEEDGIANASRMMPALVRAGLNRMSIAEDLWSLPPYWRRLAAFAHANAVVEFLSAQTMDVDGFIDWLGGLETSDSVSAALLDFRREPLWQVWDLNPRFFKAQIINRLVLLRHTLVEKGLDLPSGHLVDLAIDTLKPGGGLLEAARPGPLLDGSRMSGMGDYDKPESLSKFLSESIAKLEQEPVGPAWNRLATVCRLLRFEDTVLDALVKLPSRMALGDKGGGRQQFFETLLNAADIAATQPCEALANGVADALIREVVKIDGTLEVGYGFRILMMSSGAFTDDTAWKEWIDKKMSQFAFSLPKGAECSELLGWLDALQAQMPIKDRCLGRARKFASAAI